MKTIYQRNGNTTYQGSRIYLDTEQLKKVGFLPGKKISSYADPGTHTVWFWLDPNGPNKVSAKRKKNKEIPVLDKSGQTIRETLSRCEQVVISFVEIDMPSPGNNETATKCMVIVQGEQTTGRIKRAEKRNSTPLTSITFCAGAGISTEALKEAGFQELAAVEWNPKEGAEDKFAALYEQNNPDAVVINLPMQRVKGTDLPRADVWLATLDCTDYSGSANGVKKEYHTMHLPFHLMRLFWERSKEERPSVIIVENVPEFEKFAGVSLALCLQEEGFFVEKAKISSLQHGSRTKRERFFLVAAAFEGFSFPKETGAPVTPIAADGRIRVEDLEWVTPEESKTLAYFLERQKSKMTHNHVMTTFDITKDTHVGTITKSHHKIQPENWIVHPSKPGLYAYLKAEQVRAIQEIPPHLHLGESNKMKIESMGQSVCYRTFSRIAKSVYAFLSAAYGTRAVPNPIREAVSAAQAVKTAAKSVIEAPEENGQLAFQL